jgi:hypothetical protein
MSLLERTRSLLEDAGYDSSAAGMPADQFAFEDDNVYGFVAVLPSVARLMDGWERLQDDFIQRNSHSLNSVPEKAWNVYAVFLTEDDPDEEMRRRLLGIEEDFRGARKIARSGVRAHNLAAALAPLLPVRIGGTGQGELIAARIRQSPAVGEALANALESGADVHRLRDIFMEGK